MSETFLRRVAYDAHHDSAAGLALIRNFWPILAIGAAFSLFLFLFAPYVIIILFGEQFSGAIPIVRVLSVIPVLVNANILTSNLYMFNYGHERAWALLTVSGLLIFLAAAYFLSLYLLNAATAVAVAAIARECVVLVVSASFFLAFGSARTRIPPAKGIANGWAANVAKRPMLALRAALLWRDQLRPER
jgi:O-antigen/teichoic acid export membrane protein